MKPHKLLLALLAAFAGASFAAESAPARQPAAMLPVRHDVGSALHDGLDTSGFDPSVRPQDDLFDAVNGTWLKQTPIPGDKAAYGAATELRDRSDQRVRAIAESLAAARDATGIEKKVGDYYRSYMDVAAIDKAGLAPLKPWFAEIEALKTPSQLSAEMGRLQGRADMPLTLHVGADDMDPAVNRLQTWQGGLGLPDRDYYLNNDERYAAARTAYEAYLGKLLSASGETHPAEAAQAVMALEKRLAQAQWSRVANRDPKKTYNPLLPADLARFDPGIDWEAMFKAGALPALDKVIISQPDYVEALAKAVQEVPLDTWKAYLRVRLLDNQADVLPAAFRDAGFEFHGKAIRGLSQDEPRWQKASHTLNAALGEAVGQVYVARYFPPAHKARMQEMVGNLLAAYRESIDQLTWMGPETKKRAQQKLSKYVSKIGYPDTWRDYSRLEVVDGDAFGNDLRAGRFDYERRAVRAGQPVDRREWHMTPQTVNAYYSPSFNEVVFPAAILEPPFFDMAADDAVNYGAIGAIIGHEISHGFDDQGSQFDGDGKLDNWWTEADRKAFSALTEKLAKQYDAYEPLPGHHLNGHLTMGENIADLSGLEIAYKAYHRSLGGKPGPVIEGYTADQRFFLGFAQVWREKRREQRALQLLSIDPHSPPQFRANGTAINQDAFHEAFKTHPGDGMWKAPADRIRIW